MVAEQVFVPLVLTAVTRLSAVLLVAAGTGWGQWSATEEGKLTAMDAAIFDEFGYSVSISGETAVVGADSDDLHTIGSAGSAYVFVRNGASWTQQAKLIASDAAGLDLFGWSVSISGNTAVVGASWDDHAGGTDAGSAYVFVRNGTSWTQQAKLIANDAAAYDYFGYSVSVSGETVLIGAERGDTPAALDPGAAYVFMRSGTSWTQQAKLTASDTQSYDEFGSSVSLSGDTAVVGAYGNTHVPDTPVNEGSAYVFVRNGTNWTQQAKLTASDAADSDAFGFSVGVSGDTAVVGAWGDDNTGGANAGSAYVFVRNGASWTEQAKLTASDATEEDSFGYSVGPSGDMTVIGARGGDIPTLAYVGAAYVFVRSGTSWTEQAKLTASDAAEGDLFGWSACLSGDTAVIGAKDGDAPAAPDAGAAYVFRLHPPPMTYCTPGTSGSGCQALLSASGSASATATSGFTLSASTVEGQKDGLFFFGTNGQQANPWGNGTSYQCVIPPVVRTPTTAGVGTIGLCDGSFALDLNALWCPSCPKPAKNPGAGATVQAQLWYRDPLSTSNQTTSLSDAVEFGVGP